MVWTTEDAEPHIVTPTVRGLLVLIGLCGATREQVSATVGSGIPDDIAWRWPGAYIAVHLDSEQVSIWTSLGALPIYVRRRLTEVIWSTSARALASRDQDPRLNPSLALLAACRLAPRARAITATTLHPAGVRTGGDLGYAATAANVPGVDHAWIGRDHTHAPCSNLALPPTDEPPVSAVSFASFRDHMRWLSSHGSDIHMTGDGGDTLLLTPPAYFSEMIKRRPLRTITAATRFAQVRRMSLLQALRYSRASALAVTGLELPSLTHHTIIATLIDSARSARADVELAAAFGVRLDNPFFDTQVIDAHLSMSVEEMPEPALYKPVLVEAMGDVLPASLRHRTTKASTTADHYEGVRRSLPQIDALLDGSLASLGLIDARAVRTHARALAAGGGDLGAIERIVAFEAWWNTMKPVAWSEEGLR